MMMTKRYMGFVVAALCFIGSGGAANEMDQLVGWWDFEELQERIVPDRSGQGNQGLLTYGEWVKGVHGKGVRFGHPSASLKVRSSPSLSPREDLSLEAWVQLKGRPSGFPSVIRKEGAYALRFCDGRIGFLLWRDGQPLILAGPDIGGETDRWIHLAGTYDGKRMALYVDGQLAAEKAQEGFLDSTYAELHIGGYARSYLLNGVVDEAKVYARSLSTEEVEGSFLRGQRTLREQRDVKVPTQIVGEAEKEMPFRKEAREVTMVKPGFLWIDAEDFEDYGGWCLDTQFVHLMGSAYLIAAGIGRPVQDARTTIQLSEGGDYRLWVRSKNWLPSHSPGLFSVLVDGKPLGQGHKGKTFGRADSEDWVWEDGGRLRLEKGEVTIALKDRTGYYGRCDCLVLTQEADYVPPADTEAIRQERARLTGLSLEPQEKGTWDVIVVGAGPAGCPAALAAARTGAKTALIQNRPVLGGNASRELGVPMNGAASSHRNARESGIAEEAGRIRARYGYPKMSEPFRLMAKKDGVSVFLNQHVFDVVMENERTIAAVKAYDTLTQEISLYRAKRFIDCTGDGWVGYFAKADFRKGREARSEFNESFAPEKEDDITMSGCLMGGALNYRAQDTGKPVAYKPPPWAPPLPPPERFARHPRHFAGGQWWMEHRGTIDDIWDAERARDELIRIVFSYWNWIKNDSPFKEEAKTFALAHIPIVEAKRESRRLVGDILLNQNHVQEGHLFEDRISYGGWPLDVHHPEGIFSGEEGPFHCNPRVPIYTIPYRCLYSKNIDNLLMAGRCMSVTHIALGTVRVENTLATTGQAAGTAAALSLQMGTTPRGIFREHMAAFQQKLLKDDQTIPELPNQDPEDLARSARVTASSQKDSERFDVTGVRPEEIHELDGHDRAVLFPAGDEGRLDTISLLLYNRTEQSIKVTAHLMETSKSEDFSSKEDLAAVEASVPAGEESWVAFPFHADLSTSYAWVWLPATEGLSWRLMESAPLGSCRAYRSPGGGEWHVMAGQYYAFHTQPAIRLSVKGCEAENVTNGWSRVIGESPNMWASDTEKPLPQWIELAWDEPVTMSAVYLTFDTNMDLRWCSVPFPPECVREYEVSCWENGAWRILASETDNFQRRRIHQFDPVSTSKLRLTVKATNGVPEARVFEIRVYHDL